MVSVPNNQLQVTAKAENGWLNSAELALRTHWPEYFIEALGLGFFKQPWDAAFYTLFQFIGGVLGVFVAGAIWANWVTHSSVNYAATIPGPHGWTTALLAEIGISFLQMTAILMVSNSKRFGRWTGLFAGFLIANYITFESPLSGMSMNPARTLSSAMGAHLWTALWIYFAAPLTGMLLAAEVYKRINQVRGVTCAKLHHHNNQRCIFKCNFKSH